ncbi:hypothetical protein A7981_07350 [Methylovorus sp. MM2]|uniref:thermonuclease family protein n=1 Tax=Methylovorus sp. MM2 TaxID=1848038 RepID=UPI0007DE9C88|nr:thermonuclease family protein [Methylovorus sp. MM2]OAM53402.1 hypothetical protein A7981_07350 [Methylovorus sp. MM2]
MQLIKLLILVALEFTFTNSAYADQLQGRIIEVFDGDTVTLLSENMRVKIQLTGIDAPEMKQDFGVQSKQALSDCALDKIVVIDDYKSGKSGRSIGKVIVDGVDCNLRQVRNGMAWHDTQHSEDQSQVNQQLYADAETMARSNRIGLWSQSNPVAPWDFVHQVNVKKTQDAFSKQWLNRNRQFR